MIVCSGERASAIAAIICVFFLSSCASHRAAIKQDYDFSKIKTIAVSGFTNTGQYPNSGPIVSEAFIREFLSSGYNVVSDGSNKADAVLYGSVTEFFPNRRYLFQSGDKNTNTVAITQPIEIGGTGVYSQGTAFGLGENSQIVVSNATVGISAYLKDIRTGEIIWSNAFAYEGFDLNTALDGVVRYLVRTIPGSIKL